jgi:hypothetical protein
MRRSSKRLPTDPNLRAAEIVRLSTEESPPLESKNGNHPIHISEYLAQIGRKGGLKGGKARAKKLSEARRKEIASRAAQARWRKK